MTVLHDDAIPLGFRILIRVVYCNAITSNLLAYIEMKAELRTLLNWPKHPFGFGSRPQ